MTLLTSLALAWMSVSWAQSGVVNSTKNPNQTSILHWYPANLTTRFSLGGGSGAGVIFDGSNLWVARSRQSDSVIKIQPSDGAVLGTFATLSSGPSSMAFDGANIWITTPFGLEKVRASDGVHLLGTSGGGVSILFDGTNIWWTNGNRINNLGKVRPSDGMHLATFTIGAGVSQGTTGMAFDGANIWVAYNGTDVNGVPVHTVTKMRASDGTVLGTFSVGNSPIAVIFDGTNIWVANNADNTVTKLRASDGAVLGTFPGGASPGSMVFDGANVWVTNFSDNTVTKLRASDGAVLGTFPVSSPTGVAFDGANVWVTTNGGSLSKM